MTREAGGALSASRVRRVRLILLAEAAIAVVLGVVVHQLLFAFLFLPVLELVVKPATQRRQILGLRS